MTITLFTSAFFLIVPQVIQIPTRGGGKTLTFSIFLTKKTRKVLLSKHFQPWDARSLSVHYSPPILLAFADVWKKCRDDFHAELNSILNSTLLCSIPKIFLIPRFWSLKIFLISCLKFWVACNYWSGVGAARRRSAAQEAAMPSHLRINLGHLSKSPHASAPQARLHSTSTSCCTSPHASTNQAS